MVIFKKRKLTPVEKLTRKLRHNQYYPFKITDNGLFEYSIRYTRFLAGWIGLGFWGALLATMFASGQSQSSFFLLVVGGVILSIFAIQTYKDPRIYLLDPKNKVYSFSVGPVVQVQDELYNVYIRLRKRLDSGRTYYYLVMNGKGMDRVYLSDTVTEAYGLRELGQQMAANLGLNYFDEEHVSTHHRVIHFPFQAESFKQRLKLLNITEAQLKSQVAADLAKNAAAVDADGHGHHHRHHSHHNANLHPHAHAHGQSGAASHRASGE
jgi:hypothetical protein